MPFDTTSPQVGASTDLSGLLNLYNRTSPDERLRRLRQIRQHSPDGSIARRLADRILRAVPTPETPAQRAARLMSAIQKRYGNR